MNKNSTPSVNKNFLYEKVTKQILQSMMRDEVVPWRKTWFTKENLPLYYNPVSGTKYKALNRMLLGEPGQYITMKQAKDNGGTIRKGSKGKFVVMWSPFIPAKDKQLKEELESKGEDWTYLQKWMLKYYYVFNVNDFDGLKIKTPEAPAPMQEAQAPVDIAEMVIDDYTINERVRVDEHSGNAPGYDAMEDTVTMPQKQEFTYEEDYFAALFEQLVHSTSAECRLDRRKEFKSMAEGQMPVKEALIAEIATSMMLAVVGLDRKETVDQQKAEVRRWMEAFENDFMLIVNASTKAETAAEMVLGKFAAGNFSEN